MSAIQSNQKGGGRAHGAIPPQQFSIEDRVEKVVKNWGFIKVPDRWLEGTRTRMTANPTTETIMFFKVKEPAIFLKHVKDLLCL